jgi:hypothetical protein
MRLSAKILSVTILAASMASAGSLVGWISDASCGAGNANASEASRDCAKRCLENGAAPVFVSDGDNKVYKLAGKVSAKEHIQHKVQVTGDVKGDTITVKEIKKAS